MSKGNGSPFRSFRSFPVQPPVQQQLDQLRAGIDVLTDAISELQLQVEFAMRQIRLGRVKPGAIIDPTTGKLPMEHLTLLELYHAQRDVFAQMLTRERNEILRAQQNASAQGDGDPGHEDAAPGEPINGTASASPLILPES